MTCTPCYELPAVGTTSTAYRYLCAFGQFVGGGTDPSNDKLKNNRCTASTPLKIAGGAFTYIVHSRTVYQGIYYATVLFFLRGWGGHMQCIVMS